MATPLFTPDDLLHGVAYAIEQAGHLVCDAVTLVDAGRPASAVALAAFAREELGRSEILLKCRERARNAGPLSLDAVIERCNDHIRKLHLGQEGSTLKVAALQGVKWQQLRAAGDQSGARVCLRTLSEGANKKLKAAPSATQALGEQALYVDPSADGDWNRSSEIPATVAYAFVDEVCGDYVLRLDRLEHGDTGVADALKAWPKCPSFPKPVRPRPDSHTG